MNARGLFPLRALAGCVEKDAGHAELLPWQDARGLAPSLSAIGRAATRALHDELALSPKPGLVTLSDCGSHTDMDAGTFMRSLFALRHYFVRITALGASGAPFEVLEQCGIAAEARMLSATNGINTHRGAIFTLGLLCASAGFLLSLGLHPTPELIRFALLGRWGGALRHRASRVSILPGGAAARRYGLRSASEEAAAGFPVLFKTAIPALRRGLARQLSQERARLDTFFHVMAVLDDCNIAHRGGMEGLRFAQRSAQAFLHGGGAAALRGLARAQAIGHAFVKRNLSPGGAADILAAACWMQRIGALTPQWTRS